MKKPKAIYDRLHLVNERDILSTQEQDSYKLRLAEANTGSW